MTGVALVTGAAVRIGRAIAAGLGARGWTVAIHYRSSAEAAHTLATEIAAAGGTAACFAADFSRESEAGGLVGRVADELGPVLCLVNNAAVFEADDIASTTPQSWARHFAVNLRAPFLLTQAFSRGLPPAQAGNVINILDQRVWNLTPYFMSYTLAKSALWTLTRTSALALAPRIRVNAIGPGPTLPSRRQSDEDFRRQAASTPLRRAVGVEDIAEAVAFVLASPSLTGQMIALDAGQHLAAASRGPVAE